jgi:hypothetical protein
MNILFIRDRGSLREVGSMFHLEQIARKDAEHFQEKLGLQPGVDLGMVLLKGHLLIEKQLQSFIDSIVVNPKHLLEARLTFYQRLAVAKSLHTDHNRFGYGWVWDAVQSLNVLRNQLVHKVVNTDFPTAVQSFVSSVEPRIPFLIKNGAGEQYDLGKFGSIISVIGFCLARLCRSECEIKGKI